MDSMAISLFHALPGDAIMRAVRCVAGPKFHFVPDPASNSDAYQIGQFSILSYEHIRVGGTPLGGTYENCIRCDEKYESLVVGAYEWPTEDDLGRWDAETVAAAVSRFRKELIIELGNAGVLDEPVLRPQKVSVCRLCYLVVDEVRDGKPWCTVDGANPPTIGRWMEPLVDVTGPVPVTD